MATSAINGTNLLAYVNGTLIAAQSGGTFNVDRDLPDTSTKDDAGWSSHIAGQGSCSVDLSGLVSTTGLSAAELIAFITARTEILFLLNVTTSDSWVFKADMASVSLGADVEQPMSISGTVVGSGRPYLVSDNLITTMDDGSAATYDTFTTSGISVTSAIDAAGGALSDSDAIAVTDTYKYMVFTFLTNNGGELPKIGLYDGAAYDSNQPSMTAGANFITLTATDTDGCTLRIENTAACDFELTDVYVWEVAV